MTDLTDTIIHDSKKCVETENESWTSSDERSSGNEYSVRMKNEKKTDDETDRHEKKRKHRKKRKRKWKKKGEENNVSDESADESSRKNIDKKISREKKTLLSRVDDILDNCVSIGLDDSIADNQANKTDTIKKRQSRSKSRSASKTIIEDKTKESRSSKKSRSRSKSKSRRSSSKSEGRRKSSSKSRHSRSKSKDHRKSRSRSRDRRKSRSQSRERRKSRSRSRDCRRSKSRSRDRRRSESRSRDRRRSKSRSRDRRRSSKRSRSRSRRDRRSRSKSRDRHRSRSGSRNRRRSKSRDRRKSRNRRRSRSRSKSKTRTNNKPEEKFNESNTNSSLWDVKTVDEPKTDSETIFQKVSSLRRSGIEIKYGNTISGNGSTVAKPPPPRDTPQAAVNPYGKWEPVPVPESKGRDLTKYMKLCQEISAKESIYEDHVVDAKEESSEEEDNRRIHHPFISKPAPVLPPTAFSNRIPMNPAQAIMAGSMNSITANPADVITGPLEKHFPVSSGTDHREKENVRGEQAELPVYHEPAETEEPINVSAIIARRMGAQQLLTKNPNDAAAKKVLDECDLKLKGWTQRSKKPGKFTGERGVRMDQKQIAGAIETWVRKDFFHNLMPLNSGPGMMMMQNMGWKQGTPLGKNKEGYVAPIVFDIKVGRSGLASGEEQPQRGSYGGYNLPKKRLAPVQNVGGKHPVSALSEMCTKKHLGQPSYSCVFESGSSHNRTFLIKCTIQNVDYQPSVASPNKKHAKAQAALTALKILGME